MAKKQIKSRAIADASPNTGPLYCSFAGRNGPAVLKAHSIGEETCVVQGRATAGESGVTERAGFNRFDRDYHRPEDATPTEHKDIIRACQAIYRRIGLVRNIIDLMADFASEGLDLAHPNRSQQKFYREWAKRTNLQSRVHDFIKLMLRDANVIVRRKMGKLTLPALRQMSRGQEDIVVEEPPERIGKQKKQTHVRVIPWRYVFLSPTIVEKLGGPLARFYGDNALAMRLTPDLVRAIRSPKNKAERDLVARLPAEVLRAVRSNKNRLVPLDMSKVFVAHYKKDDWEDWGTPFLYAVLDDVMFKDKMRQADMAALDGVINVIRLWRLGKSDKQILPTKTAVNKLLNILENNVGGGVLDIVWDDMIDVKTEYPPTDKILGAEKYSAVNQDIVRGLGVPDSLLGGGEATTRNAQSAFIQLKTLVERLEYVRSKAIEWLEAELRLVCEAMGFKKPPRIIFGTMSLRDEAAEKALVIQLLDRGIISIETVHKVFGHDFIIELEHLREEQAIRAAEPPLIERTGPYNRPFSLLDRQTEDQIKVERFKAEHPGGGGGGENPSGDQPRNDSTPAGPGRPTNQPSTKPRDERTPITLSVVYESKADELMEEIDHVLDPLYLESRGLKNVRTATAEQKAELEDVKWSVLCCLGPQDKADEETIRAALDRTEDMVLASCDGVYRLLSAQLAGLLNKTPGLKERRRLMAAAWAIHVQGGQEKRA